jgi:nuclear transport factor 2 (NTF2) superfamily protein
MDRETFKQWLASYGRAWTSRDPEAAASLYTDDATYQVTPFDEPFRGRAAIYEYWVGTTKTEEKIQFDSEILAVTEEHGIARWRASFVRVPPGLETKLDGIFLISLNSGSRCRCLREWWHKRQ